jgi:hypothetical protein
VHEVEQGEGPARDLHDEEEGDAQAEGGFFRHFGGWVVCAVLVDGRFAWTLEGLCGAEQVVRVVKGTGEWGEDV